ncbi:MAG: pyridoxamine 5'-phosphate oxidase family protein [Rhizobacter sp.]|jgi:general stress protein 26|nr:pyridoxamine 5'-phosphate oxidase family protein [Rhizobacter sp.]MBP6269700.1 pyridoxamine 5'-phosphate oxidase family protein [Rhizobacter sp.]
MKIQSQSSAELIHLAQLIQPMDTVAMLTSHDADGALVSRPMAPLEMDALGALWFFTHRRSAKIEQLKALNLCFVDAERGTYVSMSGHGDIVDDREHVKRLWSPLARPWFPHGPDSEELTLLKFTPHSAEYWDAVDTKMVRLLATAVSVVAARPIGLGEHAHLAHL